MILISVFAPNIYLIKCEQEISEKELKKVSDVAKLVEERKFQLKFDEHGYWILHILK